MKEKYEKIYDVLIELGGANPRDKEQFVQYLLYSKDESFTEFRFMGKFGFGGKFYGGDRNYINYYTEDNTPEREVLKDRINDIIEEILKS